MASLVFARRFSSKLRKYSSSSSPLSYLTHTRDGFSVPKISNSFSSTFNWHCNSTAKNSKSPSDSSVNSLKSSSSQIMLNDSNTYFLAGARHENPSNLNRRVSCEKSLSKHKEYLDQLPKEFYNITPEEFRRGIRILLNSMEKLKFEYSSDASFWFLLMGCHFYTFGVVRISLGLYFGTYYVAKLLETKSIEKVRLLLKLYKRGNIQIRTAVFQLVKEVKESDRRHGVAFWVFVCSFSVLLFQILTMIFF